MNGFITDNEVINMIENNAMNNLNRDDVYEDADGFLRCKICNEPRTMFIPEIGRKVHVRCSCDDRKEREQAQKEQITQVKQKVESCVLYDNSYNAFTFSHDEYPNSSQSQLCRAYVEHWEDVKRENFGLLFSGSIGTGKSYYAAAIVNGLISKGISAIIVTTSRFVNSIRSAKDTQGLIDDLNTFKLVVLDDLGSERDTDYAVEQLENFVNCRILKKLPLIVTTNLSGIEITNPPDMRYARIFDRVMAMCPKLIVLSGNSKRIDNREERLKKINEILGV